MISVATTTRARPAAATARHALRLAVAFPVSAAVLWGAAHALGIPVPRLRRR